ncbi:MAG: AraC family transcriptional regulator [Oscillospiraceae bacterium]|nr:AraC family transcriptional regulator [Oscillospiraceae bacterium]
MNIFENTVITKVYKPLTVFSEKGRKVSIENRQYFGLSFCINGQITYKQNKNIFISNSGNAVILPRNATYTLYGDKEGLFPVINFECTNLNIEEITVLPIKDFTQYIKDFNSLSNCFLHDNKKLTQFQLLYGILEKLDSEQSNNPLSSIIGYIETHISNCNITNGFLAQKMGISEVYLRKLFISHLDVTPKQYILNIRIKTAQQLLISTSKSITEISEKCGFTSVYHFCRIFKQKTSLTPTEYITKNRTYQI